MKPILFNTDMVRAILDNRKTVTRRAVKPPVTNTIVTPPLQSTNKPGYWAFYGEDGLRRAPYRPGDVLYVREAWTTLLGSYLYRANQKPGMKNPGKWRPSIHMPREAARIFLRVTNVSVAKLQDITEDGAFSEGAQAIATFQSTRDVFCDIWNSTIKKSGLALYGWDANPWVWVIGFERISSEEAENHAIL